jgi:ribosomal-protein-alanine N-acetyltransferase
MGARFTIRPVEPRDIEAISAIEHSVFSDPWPPSAFLSLMGPYCHVATVGERVVAYLFGRGVADEGELLNLAVEPSQRGAGMARHLVHVFLAELADNGARAVFLEVRASNRAARALYRDLGFQEVGNRVRYYRKPAEDAVVMKRSLAPS